MYVQDVGALSGQPGAEPGYVTQGTQAFSTDRPSQKRGATSSNAIAQRAVCRDHRDTLTGGRAILGEFDGDQLRAAQVERDQDLDDVHGLLPGCSEQAQSTRR
jgi:hypothetical protein